MAEYTPNLNLLKKDPIADANDTFNIEIMLNENWDKIDADKKAQDEAIAAAETNAKAYTDAHEEKAAPHSGHETPAGAEQKANTAAGAALQAANDYTDQKVGETKGLIGTLSQLVTTAKTNIVAAVNEIFGKVEDVEDELTAHKAEDVTQGEIPHIGLGGSISHITDTGEAITPHLRQVNASIRGTASGNMAQVNASQDSIASGGQSQVNASRDSAASGAQSQVNASRTTTVSGQHSFTVGSLNSEVIGNVSGIICAGRNGFPDTGGCKVTADNALILVGRGVLNDEYGSIAGGLPASYTQVPSPPSTAERKYHLHCTSGDLQLAGQLTPGHSFTDVAEVFPNLTGQKQGYGLLQTIDGFGVRPAQEGERVIGVTTATAAIVLGDTPFSWQGRWLKDEWGAYIYETIIDEETGEEITYPKENPEWNPELEQQSRLQRPDEWTVVGLIGQVYVRLKEDVQPMDYVKAWQNGIGQKSLEPTNLQVMKITQEYDAEKGYKIGFCLLR